MSEDKKNYENPKVCNVVKDFFPTYPMESITFTSFINPELLKFLEKP